MRRSPVRSAGRRTLAADALLLVLGTGAALACGEIAVRALVPQQRPLSVALRHLHRPDSTLGYVMAPGFRRRVRTPEFACDLRTNSLGMREREVEPPSPGRLRVLGLGDSFVFGVHAGPASSTFLARLESRLGSARHDPGTSGDIEILNAGVEGYGTVQEVGWLERLGPTLRPNAVLLAFYLGNDFTDNSGRTRMTVVDGYQMLEASARGYREHFGRPDRRLRLWLHAHSHLYLLCKRRLVHPARRAVGRAPEPAPETGGPAKPFDYYVYDAGFAAAMQAAPAPWFAAAESTTAAALFRLRDFCAAHDCRALVVAIPARQQVDAAARRAWLGRFGLEEGDLDFDLPNRRLAALAARAGLPFFDTTPALASRIAAGDSLYLETDPHWNAAGHAAAAEILGPVVQEALLAAHPAVAGRH